MWVSKVLLKLVNKMVGSDQASEVNLMEESNPRERGIASRARDSMFCLSFEGRGAGDRVYSCLSSSPSSLLDLLKHLLRQ